MPSYRSNLINKKVYSGFLRSADGQSLATPLFKNCVRSVKDLLAQWDLDCGVNFHYLFVIAQNPRQCRPWQLIPCCSSFLS